MIEFINMNREGVWSHGTVRTRWTIDPSTLMHGWYIELRDGTVKHVMASIADPMPKKPRNKSKYHMLSLRLRNDTTGLYVFKTTSMGGRKAVGELLAAIQRQLARNRTKICPIVQLRSMSYSHEKYGTIYVPDFKIVGWTDPSDGTAKRQPVAPRLAA